MTNNNFVWDGTTSRPTWWHRSNTWEMRSHSVTWLWLAMVRAARLTRWFSPLVLPISRLYWRRTPPSTPSSSSRTFHSSIWLPSWSSCMLERSMLLRLVSKQGSIYGQVLFTRIFPFLIFINFRTSCPSFWKLLKDWKSRVLLRLLSLWRMNKIENKNESDQNKVNFSSVESIQHIELHFVIIW